MNPDFAVWTFMGGACFGAMLTVGMSIILTRIFLHMVDDDDDPKGDGDAGTGLGT